MKMAGMAQMLSHRDTTHAGDALLQLNNLRREGILCDLTILVEGREYKAHKAVMAACSDYFLNAICGGKTTATVTPGENGYITVDLEHVTLRGFVPLLEYAYTANLQVNASDVIDVLSAASYMQMFKVANACSEFMRSNILWAQSLPRLANFSGLPSGLLNGGKNGQDRALSPIISNQRASGALRPDMTSLLQAGRGLGTPPLLIPMHSMTYGGGLERLAASMAGTQNLLSRTSEMASQSLPPAISSPISSRTSKLSPQFKRESLPSPSGIRQESKTSSSPKTTECSEEEQKIPSPSLPNVNSGRKSLAMKIEAKSDDEDSRSSLVRTQDGKEKSVSPTGSEIIEDSWQAIQKMYSMSMTESNTQRHHPYRRRPDDQQRRGALGSRTPDFNEVGSPIHSDSLEEQSLRSARENDNNNNNNNNSSSAFPKFLGDMMNTHNVPDLRKSPADLLSNAGTSPTVYPATAAAINGAMRSALLQQQQLMTAQQNGTDPNKMVALPAVPSTGQYMSVRRRTLQSTVPKPHQCQICGSRFTRFHNLKQHIKLHSGIKPYECDECGKRFTRNYTLRLHKMKHVGIRNFRCGTCDASFTSLGEFRAHLRLTMHSHIAGSQSPSQGSSEPEDLSTPISMMGTSTGSVGTGRAKYPAYDAASTMLNIHHGILGEGRASLLNAAFNGNMATHGDGNGSITSSLGSPQLSERSNSPEDLSTKTELSKDEKLKEHVVDGELNDKSGNVKGDFFGDKDVSLSKICQKGALSAVEDGEDGGSLIHENAESSSSEKDEEGMNHMRDSGNDDDVNDATDDLHSDNRTNSSSDKNNTQQPISLVVNASA